MTPHFGLPEIKLAKITPHFWKSYLQYSELRRIKFKGGGRGGGRNEKKRKKRGEKRASRFPFLIENKNNRWHMHTLQKYKSYFFTSQFKKKQRKTTHTRTISVCDTPCCDALQAKCRIHGNKLHIPMLWPSAEGSNSRAQKSWHIAHLVMWWF